MVLVFMALVAAVLFRAPKREVASHAALRAETGKPDAAAKEHQPWQAQTFFDTTDGPSYLLYNTPPWQATAPVMSTMPVAGIPYDACDCPAKPNSGRLNCG
jgi:hypothetical protein